VIAHGFVFLIARFGGPHGDQLGLASFGGTIRLLASAAGDYGGAHRHTGTVHPQVHGGSHCAHRLHATAFVVGDFGAQRFGGSFHLLDTDFDSRQLVEQRAAFRKAHQRRRAAGHPQNSWREGKQFQAQSTIARAESALAWGTVIVGSLQMQRPQYAFKCFLVAAMILGRFSARAGQLRARMIAGIGIQPLFQGARGCLQRFEI
jgi:hypothetical protein